MRIAGGRTTDEELRQDARDRQRKSRAKKKVPPPIKPIKAEPKPEPTFRDKPDVTESQEVSIEQRKAEMAALDLSAGETAAEASARHLAEFIKACWTHLPNLVGADRWRARELANMLTSESKAETA